MTKKRSFHLRLVQPPSPRPNEKGPVHDTDPHLKTHMQNVYLPFSRETLWLRMEPCVCGGAHLFYVRLVDVDDLCDHKPCLRINGRVAEEIVLAQHVEYKRVHRFFGISPLRLVLKNVFRLRRKLVMRDFGLHQSTVVKQYFEDAFGI